MFLEMLSLAFANPSASHFIRMGLPRLVVQQSQLAIQKNPDDEISFATLGIGYARLGQYADAKAAFLCSGKSEHEHALEYLADTYRYLGDVESSVEIRTSLLWNDQTQDQDRVRIYYDIIEDYRFAQDYNQALAIAEELIGFHPKAMLGWAQIANIAMDENRMDEAYMYIHIVETDIQDGRKSPKELIYIQSRYEYLMGNYQEAHDLLQQIFQQQVTNENLYLFALIKKELFGTNEALQLLERNKFQYNEHPKILELKRDLYSDVQNLDQKNDMEDLLQIYQTK